MSEKWLRCTIGQGMFSDELAVTVSPRPENPTEVTSVFVPKSLVRTDEGTNHRGRLKVETYQRDTIWWAILPTEDQINIPVREIDLVSS